MSANILVGVFSQNILTGYMTDANLLEILEIDW